MADTKISDLPAIVIPIGTDEVPTVNSGDTKHVTVANLLSLLSTYKNLIINGNPLVNQRAYISATNTTGANEYTLDRWRVVSSTQSLGFAISENVVTLTLPAGGIEQVIEGLNIQSGTHTISFVATGDTVCTVDAVTKVSGDTFTLTGGANATIKFSSALGTGTVKLIQVEQGAFATAFEHRPFALELDLCQRYFQKTYDLATAPGTPSINSGQRQNTATVTTDINGPGAFPVRMRIAPTVVIYSFDGTIAKVSDAANVDQGGTVTVTGAARGESGIMNLSATGLTASELYRYHYTANAEI